MAKALNRPQRTLYKVTNQAFLLALGIVIVGTLGFMLALLNGIPVAKSEGLKLLGLYAIFGLIAFFRYLSARYLKSKYKSE